MVETLVRGRKLTVKLAEAKMTHKSDYSSLDGSQFVTELTERKQVWRELRAKDTGSLFTVTGRLKTAGSENSQK